VEVQWRLFSLTLRYNRWIMGAVRLGVIAVAVLWIAPPGRIMDEYPGGAGYPRVTGGRGRAAKWAIS
jgi:hypothetical protein